MPLDTAALITIVALVCVVGVKMITGTALNSTRRGLVRLRERRGELLVELGHEAERRKTTTGTLAFYEQRKLEVEDQILFAREDLAEMKAKAEAEDGDKPKEKTVGIHNPSSDIARGFEQ